MRAIRSGPLGAGQVSRWGLGCLVAAIRLYSINGPPRPLYAKARRIHHIAWHTANAMRGEAAIKWCSCKLGVTSLDVGFHYPIEHSSRDCDCISVSPKFR